MATTNFTHLPRIAPDIPEPDYQKLVKFSFVRDLCDRRLRRIPDPTTYEDRLPRRDFRFNLCNIDDTMHVERTQFKKGQIAAIGRAKTHPLKFVRPRTGTFTPSRDPPTGTEETYCGGIEFILNAYHLYLHFYDDPYVLYFPGEDLSFRYLLFEKDRGDLHNFGVGTDFAHGDVIGLWQTFVREKAPVPDWFEKTPSSEELDRKSLIEETIRRMISNLSKAVMQSTRRMISDLSKSLIEMFGGSSATPAIPPPPYSR